MSTEGITVGSPATLSYYRDTYAAVVTKVTPKTITIARVEVGPSRPDWACDVGAYGLRPMMADGILDKIIEGTERRFSFTRGMWRNGSQRAYLGYSREWRDWRD